MFRFDTADAAAAAVASMDNVPLDKKHTFRVFPYADFERLAAFDDIYREPEKSEFHLDDDLHSWFHDEDVRDQFVLRYGEETQIMWHDPLMNDGMSLAYGGESQKLAGRNWTEMGVVWSPLGTYFATFHLKGVMLWGGKSFVNIGRFSHAGVKFVDFSPCENFLVTLSGIEAVNRGDPDCIHVYDIRSQKKLRGFSGT